MTNSNEKQTAGPLGAGQGAQDHAAMLIALFALTTAQISLTGGQPDRNSIFAKAQELVDAVPLNCDVKTRKTARDLIGLSKLLSKPAIPREG